MGSESVLETRGVAIIRGGGDAPPPISKSKFKENKTKPKLNNQDLDGIFLRRCFEHFTSDTGLSANCQGNC